METDMFISEPQNASHLVSGFTGADPNGNSLSTEVPIPDFYDFNGSFSGESFEKLTGLAYINYLHSHDDMI